MSRGEVRKLALHWCGCVLRAESGRADPPPECKMEKDVSAWMAEVTRIGVELIRRSNARKRGVPGE